MMIAHPNAAEQKRDLHVGGVGTRTGGALAAITHPMIESPEASNDLAWQARHRLNEATDAVRENPWTAIGLVALAGLAAGYLLGRR